MLKSMHMRTSLLAIVALVAACATPETVTSDPNVPKPRYITGHIDLEDAGQYDANFGVFNEHVVYERRFHEDGAFFVDLTSDPPLHTWRECGENFDAASITSVYTETTEGSKNRQVWATRVGTDEVGEFTMVWIFVPEPTTVPRHNNPAPDCGGPTITLQGGWNSLRSYLDEGIIVRATPGGEWVTERGLLY